MLDAVEKIKESDKNPHIYIACTGAAANLTYQLWQVPGASSFFVGSSFTYATNETDDFIGFKPEGYCTEDTAMEMAMASYIRACEYEILNNASGFPIGVGISASVASTRIHRGDHRVFFAFMTPNGMFCHQDVLRKGAGETWRRSDDQHCTLSALQYIYFLSNEDTSTIEACKNEYLHNRTKEAEELLFKRPLFGTDGRRYEAPKKAVFLPGSFNPIHDGHRGMLNAVKKVGKEVLYGITISSMHKPALELNLALHKAAMFKLEKWNHKANPFIFTRNDPLFLDKARQFPGSKFIVGSDTLIRLLDPSWGVEPDVLVDQFLELETGFYVFDRKIDGQNVSLFDIYNENNQGSSFRKAVDKGLFMRMHGDWDVSSTQIRNS